MDAKLKAKAMTEDELDGVAGGRVMWEKFRVEVGSWQEVNNGTCPWQEVDNMTKNKQPTLNTYSYKFP